MGVFKFIRGEEGISASRRLAAPLVVLGGPAKRSLRSRLSSLVRSFSLRLNSRLARRLFSSLLFSH